MTKEAHEAYASGAASALQGMNIPEEVKIAAFRYMTKEANPVAKQAVKGLSTLTKSLLGLGAAGGVGTAAIAADRYGLPGMVLDSEADKYQARYGNDYAQRVQDAAYQRSLREVAESGEAGQSLVSQAKADELKKERLRQKALRTGYELLDDQEQDAKAKKRMDGGSLIASTDKRVTLDKNLLKNLGYGAAGAAGLYGLYRLTR